MQRKAPSSGKLIPNTKVMTFDQDICRPFDVSTYKKVGISQRWLLCRNDIQLQGHWQAEIKLQNYVSTMLRGWKWVQSQVKKFHYDNAREFLMMRKELWRKGIVLSISSSYSPQSNGLSQRTNRALLHKFWSVLKELTLNHRYWSEAIKHAAYLHNRATQTALQKRRPWKMLFGKLPNNSSIREFDCAAYLQLPNATRNKKLSDHAELGIYLRNRNRLFWVYALRTTRVMETKHVSFDWGRYPRQKKVSCISTNDLICKRTNLKQIGQTQKKTVTASGA